MGILAYFLGWRHFSNNDVWVIATNEANAVLQEAADEILAIPALFIIMEMMHGLLSIPATAVRIGQLLILSESRTIIPETAGVSPVFLMELKTIL